MDRSKLFNTTFISNVITSDFKAPKRFYESFVIGTPFIPLHFAFITISDIE